MLQFKHALSQALASAIDAAAPGMAPTTSELSLMLEYPPDKSMGDLAFPCFRLSKVLRKAPPMIAAMLKEALHEVPYLERTEVVGGYLNFFLDNIQWLWSSHKRTSY